MPFVALGRAQIVRRPWGLAAILAVLIALLSPSPAAASSREASMVVDMNSGRVLHEHAANELRFPASLTKMMTLYILFGEIEAGRMSYGTRIKISERAAAQVPSKLDLDPGEEITVINAIKGLITKSANDVAVAVAEHIGGSEAAFARMMTERARRIGMTRTTFRNASGLPDTEQVTTARDMMTLSMRLFDDHPRHWPLFSTRFFSYEGNTYRNHNTLLGTYEGADGIKTGYIRMSGFNVVTSVQRHGKHLMVAVFGGTTAAARNATARNLLNRALLQASTRKTRRPAPMLVATARPVSPPARPPVAQAARAVPAPVAASRPQARPTPAALATTSAVPVPATQERLRPSGQPEEDRAAGAATDVIAAHAAGPDENDRASIAMLFAEAAAAPTIEIARVRPVALLPRTSDEPPVLLPTPSDQPLSTDQFSGPPGRAGSFASQRHALAPPSDGTAATGAVGRPPSTLDAQARELSTNEPPLPGAQYALAPIAQPEPRIAAAASAMPAPFAGDFQLQVGAFATEGEAERMLSATRARTGDLLRSYRGAAIPVQKDNRRLFRARYTGFDAAAASAVCTELRRQNIDCFVMKAE